EGKFGDAIGILERGAAADLTAKSAEEAATKYTTIGYAHLLAGRKREAIEAADTALTKDTSKEVRFLAARVFAEAGALDKAQALGAALSSELPLEPRALGKNIEGLVLLKSGKAGQAVDKLQEANKLIDTWFGHFDLGRAFLEADGLPQADSEFDRCIT